MQSEIKNLLGVLAKMGAEAASLIDEGLPRFKAARAIHQGRLKEARCDCCNTRRSPRTISKVRGTLTGIGQLLDEADLSEQIEIVQHFV